MLGKNSNKTNYDFAKKVLQYSNDSSIPVISVIDNLNSTTAIGSLGTTIPSSDSGCQKLYTEATRILTADPTVSKIKLYEMLYDFMRLADIVTNGTSNFARTFNFDGYDPSGSDRNAAVEKPAGSRHANSSKVKVEIRCGRDKSNIFSLSAVQIDYVKAPQFIRLTQEQLDSDEDISQIMEFPDYVNQEIVNELVNLVMRKTNDPTLQAHMQMTQSIARPTGQ